MDHLTWCIEYLKKVNNINNDNYLKKLNDYNKLRALMNITMPYSLSDEFYIKQDKVLKERLKTLNTIDVNDLQEIRPNISLFKGDITLLKSDAIVDACNNQLLGCFRPLHNCIDNAIHSYSGLEVRRDLLKIMKEQNFHEESGKCKVTSGYNLPSKYIFHTVGPIVEGKVKEKDILTLGSCYKSCLEKAKELKLKTIVFCSISTGVFAFPIEKASEVALKTTFDFLKVNNDIKVIFDLFSENDYETYARKINELYK